MILSSHGIIGSQILQIDADAAAFFARVTDAGGTLSATEQSAILTLVADLKDDGIWNSMKAIYPMVGASAAACAQNLKSSSFTGTFTATGWTFASTGVTPDGSSAFMDTGLNMASELSQNNVHCSVYLTTNLTGSTASIGAADSSVNRGIYIFPKLTSTQAYFSAFDSSGGNSFAVITTSLGLVVSSRQISTTQEYYQNGVLITSNLRSSTIPNFQNIYIGAWNNGATAANFDTRENAFASIGMGLSTADNLAFYTAVQAFQTTLNREVI